MSCCAPAQVQGRFRIDVIFVFLKCIFLEIS